MAGQPAIRKAEERLEMFASALLAFKFNGTQAAISIGVPPKGASTYASVTLRNPQFQTILAEKLELLKLKHDLTIDKIIIELKHLGFSNLEDYTRLTEDGLRVVDVTETTRDQMAAVQELTVEENILKRSGDEDEESSRTVTKRTTKIKLHDKKGALVDLLKYLTGTLGRMDGAQVNVFNNQQNLTQNNVNVTVQEAEAAYRKMLDSGE